MRARVLLATAACLGCAFTGLAPDAFGRPLNVRITPARGAPAATTVSASGATLTATTPSGTRFRLVVPPGALYEGQKLTMAAVAALGGLPFRRGIGGAVQLGPEGLRLRKPALLTIVPRRAIPLRRQAPYAFRAGGRDLHLQAPTLSRARVVVPILHFSGYGLGDATVAQRRAVASRRPASPEARAEGDLGDALQDARNAADGFDDPTVRDRIARALLPLYQHVVTQLQTATGGGDWRSPVGAAINLDRQLNLLGYSRTFLSFEPPPTGNRSVAAKLGALQRRIPALIFQVLGNAYARERKACADTRQRQHAIEMLDIGKTETFLGQARSVGQILQDARPCLRRGFKFSVTTTIVHSSGTTQWTYTGKACGTDVLAAEWTLAFDAGGFGYTQKVRFPSDGVLPEVRSGDPSSGDGFYTWGTRFTLFPGSPGGPPGAVKLDLNPLAGQPEWTGSYTAPLEDNEDCPPPDLPAWVRE